MLYLLPLQSPMVGRILDRVPGHTNIGCCRNFVHLVTGHTPGRINRNGTVVTLERELLLPKSSIAQLTGYRLRPAGFVRGSISVVGHAVDKKIRLFGGNRK